MLANHSVGREFTVLANHSVGRKFTVLAKTKCRPKVNDLSLPLGTNVQLTCATRVETVSLRRWTRPCPIHVAQT